jgi:hypothetical protein
MSLDKPCTCAMCSPQPGQDPHPLWGYDRNAAVIPTMVCALCKKVIGDEPYVESPGRARYGAMDLIHKACETEKDARARARMETSQRKRLKKYGVI